MSRRRAINPTRPIGITLKQSLIRRIDDYLNYNQSRSLLISNCIERFLDESPAAKDLSTYQLMVILNNRPELDDTLNSMIYQWIMNNRNLPESGKK